jgi:pyruvate dehydrogenase E1 component alpha subunit
MSREQQTRSQTLAQKAIAYGFPGIQVDGNDLLGCYVAARDAVERARAGKGPTFIECVTYRICAHTTADDPRRYRSEAEVQEWQKRDPLLRFQKYLQAKRLWSPELEQGMKEAIHAEIDEALHEAEADAAHADPLEMFDHTFAELTPELQAQKEQAAEFTPREAAPVEEVD